MPYAGQLRGPNPPKGWPKNRTAVDALNKTEAAALAETLGLAVSPAWRATELKEMIKDSLYPTGAEDDRVMLLGLGSKKKWELQELAEKVCAHLTPGMTCGKCGSTSGGRC